MFKFRFEYCQTLEIHGTFKMHSIFSGFSIEFVCLNIVVEMQHYQTHDLEKSKSAFFVHISSRCDLNILPC